MALITYNTDAEGYYLDVDGNATMFNAWAYNRTDIWVINKEHAEDKG